MTAEDHIAAFVRKYVNEGMSRRKVADHLGLSEVVVRRFEDGGGIRPESAKPIADYLGVEVTDLPQFAALVSPTADRDGGR